MNKHSYGYTPDKVDDRDFSFSVTYDVETLPKSVDLRDLCSPVRDQGNLGSCTGFAMATGFREFKLNKHDEKFTELSPLFLYYNERVLENSIDEDSGATIRDGMKVLNKIGVSPEKDCPYIITRFSRRPSLKATRNAKLFKIKSYYRLRSLHQMKDCLANGNGIAIGFKVYESFESDDVAQTGNMPMPLDNEEYLGGHAVFVVGYDDERSVLIVKNSWGDYWGDKGYFYMPYNFVRQGNVIDAWTGTIE